MTKIKICGVTDPEQGHDIAKMGADWVGINFWPQSSRYLDVPLATEVARGVRDGGSVPVGVFVNQDPVWIQKLLQDGVFDWVQLHGSEDMATVDLFSKHCIHAFRLSGEVDVSKASLSTAEMVLVDAAGSGYGGSGTLADWSLAKKIGAVCKKVLLAGGLTPENVVDGIAAVRPFGVDTASGVESSPGKKDLDLVKQFIDAVRGADFKKEETS